MSKKSLLLCLILSALTSCNPNAGLSSKNTIKKNNLNSQSIINGNVIANDDELAKSVVNLLAYDNQQWISSCTGSVLNKRIILTAAHCLKYVNSEDLRINFSKQTVDAGSNLTEEELNQKFVLRKVKSFKVHPKFDGFFGNHDLALILIQGEIPETHKPVHLLPKKYVVAKKDQTTFDQQAFDVELYGFGVIQEDPFVTTTEMRKTTVTALFDKQFVVTYQAYGSGACHGDSGGPAFLKIDQQYYQVGVTHGPHGDSRTCHEEGEYMNPAIDIYFINKTIKALLKEI